MERMVLKGISDSQLLIVMQPRAVFPQNTQGPVCVSVSNRPCLARQAQVLVYLALLRPLLSLSAFSGCPDSIVVEVIMHT